MNHEKLFSGEITTPPFSPSRLWRVSPAIFKERNYRGCSPFTYVTGEKEIRDYAMLSPVDRSTVQMLMINAEKWLENRRKNNDFKEFSNDRPLPSSKLIEETVRIQFLRVIRRQPSKEEIAKYAALLTRNIEIGGNMDGLLTTIKTMFLSPEAIYRAEFGLGETDEHGRRHLSPAEIAYAIAYALTDLGPERTQAIRESMIKAKLSTKEDVARVVREVLDERIQFEYWNSTRLPRIMRFFNEYFGVPHALNVFKDDTRRNQAAIGFWYAEGLMFDAKLIIIHHLKKDQNFIEEILTTDRFFVAHPGDNEYAQRIYEENGSKVIGGIRQFPGFGFTNEARGIGDLSYIRPYNLPGNRTKDKQLWDWPVEQPIRMPRRAGILTHPAWLTAHSF